MMAALLAYVLRGAAIAALALGVRAALVRYGTAASRHLALALGAAALLLAPALTALLPAWPVALPFGWRAAWPLAAAALGDRAAATALGDRAAATALGDRAAAGRALVALWLVGAAWVACRRVAGYRRAARLAARATALDSATWSRFAGAAAARLGVATPCMRVSDELGSPVVAGIWRPLLLLPRAALDWEPEHARMTLLHELAHVRRRDGLVQLLGHAATVVCWFDPLAWLLAHQLRHERELAADEHVIQSGERASSYAAHLVAVALEQAAPTPEALLALASRSPLGTRVEAVLSFDSACRVRALGRVVLVVVVTGLSLTASALQPAFAAPAPNQPAAARIQSQPSQPRP